MKTHRTFQKRCACGIIAAGFACLAQGALQLAHVGEPLETARVLALAPPETLRPAHASPVGNAFFHQNARP